MNILPNFFKEILTPQIKIVISFGIFLFVNILFSIKYISRYTDVYIIPVLLIITILSFVFFFHQYLNLIKPAYSKFLMCLCLLFYIALCALIFKTVSVETLNVDRWSVITSFWESFEKGEYVYFAKSNVGNPPGPMPFYFILAYPFYLLGELGWYSALGFPIFILLLRYSNMGRNMIMTCLILLFFSLFIWYEILCRSNIFLNGALVLFSIVYFFNKKELKFKHLLISSILFGLFLSMRSIFSIAYIIAYIYALKTRYISFKQFIFLCCISILSFIITFLPFIVNHWLEFFSANPFIIQSTFLMPFAFTVIFIALAFVFGALCKNYSDIYFYISLNLFLCILTYFITQVYEIGLREAIFGWTADIAYFIFPIPFALFYICDRYAEKSYSK